MCTVPSTLSSCLWNAHKKNDDVNEVVLIVKAFGNFPPIPISRIHPSEKWVAVRPFIDHFEASAQRPCVTYKRVESDEIINCSLKKGIILLPFLSFGEFLSPLKDSQLSKHLARHVHFIRPPCQILTFFVLLSKHPFVALLQYVP